MEASAPLGAGSSWRPRPGGAAGHAPAWSTPHTGSSVRPLSATRLREEAGPDGGGATAGRGGRVSPDTPFRSPRVGGRDGGGPLRGAEPGPAAPQPRRREDPRQGRGGCRAPRPAEGPPRGLPAAGQRHRREGRPAGDVLLRTRWRGGRAGEGGGQAQEPDRPQGAGSIVPSLWAREPGEGTPRLSDQGTAVFRLVPKA